MIDELGILPQSSMKRTRRSRATLLESVMRPPIRGTSMCRKSLRIGFVFSGASSLDDRYWMIDELGILPQSSMKRTRRCRATLHGSFVPTATTPVRCLKCGAGDTTRLGIDQFPRNPFHDRHYRRNPQIPG
jgi:hypothetical protein